MNNQLRYQISSNAYPTSLEGRIVVKGPFKYNTLNFGNGYYIICDANTGEGLGLMHKDNLLQIDRRIVIMKSGRYGKVKAYENDWLIVEMEDSPIIEVVSEDEICDADFWDSWEEPEPRTNKKAAAFVICAILVFVGFWVGATYALTAIKERNTIEYKAIDNRSGARSTER